MRKPFEDNERYSIPGKLLNKNYEYIVALHDLMVNSHGLSGNLLHTMANNAASMEVQSTEVVVDPRVRAIRADKRVGVGSCTYIDETFSDSELVEDLDMHGIWSPVASVRWAMDFQEMKLDQGTNASSGEKDCPLIAAYQAWVNWEDEDE